MSSVEARLRLFARANTILTGARVVTAAAIFGFVFGALTFGVIIPRTHCRVTRDRLGNPAALATPIIPALHLSAACLS